MALSSDSRNKEYAWDFIDFVTATEQQYALRKASFQAPTSASELALLQADTELTALQRETLAAMSKAVDNGSLLPNIPQWSQIQDRLNVALQEALGGQKTAQRALDDAQSDIEAILSR
jgi:multiple sugar transport system substrate-binding protein